MRTTPNRREFVGAVGATTLAVAVAGCGEPSDEDGAPGDDDEAEDDDGEPEPDEPGAGGPGAEDDVPPHEDDFGS